MNWESIVISAVVIVIFIAILGAYLRSQKNVRVGIQGEKKVAGILKRFAGIRSFKVINDI